MLDANQTHRLIMGAIAGLVFVLVNAGAVPATMGDVRWPLGEAEVQNLIDQGEIEEVEPSELHASLLIRQAETHLASAPVLLPDDPPGAFAAVRPFRSLRVRRHDAEYPALDTLEITASEAEEVFMMPETSSTR